MPRKQPNWSEVNRPDRELSQEELEHFHELLTRFVGEYRSTETPYYEDESDDS